MKRAPHGDAGSNRSTAEDAVGGATAGSAATAGVIAPPPLIYLAALGLGFLAEWLLPGAELPDAFTWVGFALIALGLGIDIWFSVTLRRARTPVNPYSPTEALVTSGPYEFSRNPAYVGMAV